MNSGSQGSNCSREKACGIVSRSTPDGSAWRLRAKLSASSIAAKPREAVSYTAWPVSVTSTRRVVRLSSWLPRRASSS